MRVLMIDNYDSFTFNLVQAFEVLGAVVIVHRNDAITARAAEQLGATHLVISPGPGGPREAGVSMSMIEHFAGKLPILGVCLGHQAMAEVFGGKVVRAPRLMHGKPSDVRHDGKGVYAGVANPFAAGRYHSLCVALDAVPKDFTLTCTTEAGEIMGMRHTSLPIEGVQFHPESVLTPCGPQLLANFLTPGSGASVLPLDLLGVAPQGGAGKAGR